MHVLEQCIHEYKPGCLEIEKTPATFISCSIPNLIQYSGFTTLNLRPQLEKIYCMCQVYIFSISQYANKTKDI